MTDDQIDQMLDWHRILIRNELKILIHRINQEPNAEALQEKVNFAEWLKFSKWLKEIRDE
jgi:aromatic ring-cleaving dioxygenase